MSRIHIAAVSLLLLCSLCYAQDQPVLIHGCEDTAGMKLGSGVTADSVLQTNTDPAFISEGKGSLHISSVSAAGAAGNTYLSVDVPIAPLSLVDKRVLFDAWSSTPETSKALYLRAYAADGKCVASWLNWDGLLKPEKTVFDLPVGWSGETLAWEQSMVEADTSNPVVLLRFYVGTGEKGAAFDLYVDNIRTVTSHERSFEKITEACTLYLDTPIVENGQARAIIVTPAGAEWEQLGDEVATTIEKATGTRLDVKIAETLDQETLEETNAIILGSVLNNPLLLYPYAHELVFVDGTYPGTGGYEVRSVHNPWGTGRNLIAIGSNDIEGARAGIEAFGTQLAAGNTLVVKPFNEVKLTGEAERRFAGLFTATLDENWLKAQAARAEQGIQTGSHTGLFSTAAGVGMSYAQTRRPEYAQAFAIYIRRAYEHYLTKPQTYGGPWGMDSDFAVHRVIPAWDNIEECPVLTDAERMEITRILVQWTAEVCPRKIAAASSTRVRFNHQTFPALGLLYAGQYMERSYPDAIEGPLWVKLADGTFQYQTGVTKAHCDCNGYQWLTNYHTMRYALNRPDLGLFDSDRARVVADYVIHTMDNLGYQVPYGDMGGWGSIGGEVRVLRAAEWFYRDGRYQWAINKKMGVRASMALGDFETATAEAAEPQALVGAQLLPLDAAWYESFAGNEYVEPQQAFDKVIFRDGFEPDDAYLLLDGLSGGGHGHFDGNSILRWTQNGRIWLGETETDRFSSPPKNHNGVLIITDGQSQKIPLYCGISNFADLPSASISRSVCNDYAGVDWNRYVLWLHGKCFIVIDSMRADQAGDYSFRSVWQTVGDVTLNGADLDIEQKGQHARIAMPGDTRCILTHDKKNAGTWAGYPHVEDSAPYILQGIVNATMPAGGVKNLFTVLHASGEQASAVTITRLTDSIAVIKGFDEPIIVGVPDAAGAIDLPGVGRADADLFCLTPTKAYAAALRGVDFMGMQPAMPEAEADVEVNLTAGEATFLTPARTSILAGQEYGTMEVPAQVPTQLVRTMVERLAASAQPLSLPPTAGADVPTLPERWRYADIPTDLLLTHNKGMMGGVDAGLRVEASPAPRAQNWFDSVGAANVVENLLDGEKIGVAGSTQWDDDQEVTISLGFDRVCEVNTMLLHAWFATASSKNKLFQLGRVRVLASSDGFANDTRTVVDFTDEEMHGNWGAPGHGPQEYRFDGLDAKAKDLRVVLTPRPGTAVYVSELMVWGDGEGLAVEQAEKQEAIERFHCIHSADLDGDGAEEVLAGSRGGKLYCIGADGAVRWTFDCRGAVEAVSTVDFNGDGKLTIIAGGLSATVFAISATGEELWNVEIPYYKRTANVRNITPVDFAGDGKQSAVVGADNWRYFAFDGSGKQLWQYESVHGATAGCAADVDGDGDQEAIATTEYYSWHCIAPDGKRIWEYSSGRVGGPRCYDVAAGDIDGDGAQEVLFAGADTNIHAVDGDGKLLWAFNTGDEVRAIECVDVDGDKVDEVLAGSVSFNLYCVDGKGQMVWRTDLNGPVLRLTVFERAGKRCIAAGTEDGHVYLADAATGALQGVADVQGEVLALESGALSPDAPTLLVASTDGNLYALQMP